MKITGTLSDEYSNGKGNFQDINLEIDLDLRDYFAAKAMQGILIRNNVLTRERDGMQIDAIQNVAQFSYVVAEAMLLERSKNDK